MSLNIGPLLQGKYLKLARINFSYFIIMLLKN